MSEQLAANVDTGITQVDEEHQKLLAALDAIAGRLRNRPDVAELRELLAVLDKHASEHFVEEERYMAAMGFPSLGGHKLEHQRLLSLATTRQQEVEANGPDYDMMWATYKLLANGLRQHTQRADVAFATWVRDRAVARRESAATGLDSFRGAPSGSRRG